MVAEISGHTAVLAIDGDTQQYSALDPASLRETVMTRVLGMAAVAGQPITMLVREHDQETGLLVSPSGQVSPTSAPVPVVDEATRWNRGVDAGLSILDQGGPAWQQAPAGPPAGPTPSYAPAVPTPAPTGPPPSSPPVHGSHRAERPSFITVGRAIKPAERGWRGKANGLGMKLKPGREEDAYRVDVDAVSRHWPGTRTVAVANQKGSASKTPTCLCLAAVFARFGGAGVLAWDNNETEGTMRYRSMWSPHQADLLHMLPKVDQLLAPTAGVAEVAAYVHHQPEDKYDVLWSDTTIDGDHVVSAEDVENVHRVASRYYRMVLMDSGNSNRAPNWRAMIDHADTLVVPCTNVEDTAEVGARLLETLGNRDAHSAQLARNALVVVSQRTKHSRNMDRIVRDFEGLARRVVRIPYDPGLETGVIRFGALEPDTQRAWLAAASALTEAL